MTSVASKLGLDCKKLGAMLKRSTPLLLVVFLQIGYAGMSIIAKFALNQGMSPHVFVVYRHIVATLAIAPFALKVESKRRPKMTKSIFFKIVILGLLEPVMDQNLFYTGMQYSTAIFTSAMCNVLPAFAFIMAWVFRLESVNLRRLHSQAKILGTIVTIGGAMLMTLVKGTVIDLPWAHNTGSDASSASAVTANPIKGAIMITVGCLCCSGFVILQAITMKSYPAELSLTAMICLMGSIEGSVFAIAMDGGFKKESWALELNSILFAAFYGGILCSGLGYYFQGKVMKAKGPVFVTAFNPLSMIIVTVMSSFILKESLFLGRVMGAIVIVAGLYMVLWGKSNDKQDLPDTEKPLSVAAEVEDPDSIPGPAEETEETELYMAKDFYLAMMPK